jgi:hypothetical protein
LSEQVKHPEAPPDDENFLQRWSRRKQQPEPAPESESERAPSGETAEAEAQPGDADMPPLESLTEDSDYSAFLSPNVSDELRNLALRKLFHSASFNVCDGLDDYADDFSSFAKLGDIVTAELRHRLEQEARRETAAPDAPDTPEADALAEPPADLEASEISHPTQEAASAGDPEEAVEDKP